MHPSFCNLQQLLRNSTAEAKQHFHHFTYLALNLCTKNTHRYNKFSATGTKHTLLGIQNKLLHAHVQIYVQQFLQTTSTTLT